MFERTVWAAHKKNISYTIIQWQCCFFTLIFQSQLITRMIVIQCFFLHGKNIAMKTVKMKLCINCCSLLTVCVGSGNMSWCLHKYKLEWSWCTAVSSRTGWIWPKKNNQLKSMSILLIYVQAVYIYYLQFIYFLWIWFMNYLDGI